jgi:hypothetical protein
LRRAVAFATTVIVELLLIGAGYQLYSTVRMLVLGQSSAAYAHGFAVLHLEQRLHLAWEQPLQQVALRVPGLIPLADAAYVYLYLPFLAITALALFVRDRALYAQMRRTFLLSGGIGLVIFALFPDAPPRLLPGAGFIDTIARFDPRAGYAHNPFANQFAAIPSFHFGWCAAAALFLRRATPWRPVRALLLALPVLMLGTIVVTANHLWLDALAGGGVVLVAALLAAQMPALVGLFLARVQRTPSRPNVRGAVSGSPVYPIVAPARSTRYVGRGELVPNRARYPGVAADRDSRRM